MMRQSLHFSPLNIKEAAAFIRAALPELLAKGVQTAIFETAIE